MDSNFWVTFDLHCGWADSLWMHWSSFLSQSEVDSTPPSSFHWTPPQGHQVCTHIPLNQGGHFYGRGRGRGRRGIMNEQEEYQSHRWVGWTGLGDLLCSASMGLYIWGGETRVCFPPKGPCPPPPKKVKLLNHLTLTGLIGKWRREVAGLGHNVCPRCHCNSRALQCLRYSSSWPWGRWWRLWFLHTHHQCHPVGGREGRIRSVSISCMWSTCTCMCTYVPCRHEPPWSRSPT